MRVHQGRSGLVGLALLAVAGCGGGDGGTNPPPPPVVASVGVSLAASSITVGQTTTGTAVARTAQGATIAGKTATWSSASPGVATVDGAGTVAGVSAGTAQINAVIDGVTGSATVTVTPVPVATVTVTLSSRNLAIGQTTQAAAVTRDQSGNALIGRTVTWASGNTAVATVSTAGVVTAIAEGKAAITGTSEGRSGQDTVTVSAAVSLSELTLLRADGTPLDTTSVAGTIRVEGNPVVPAGFRGTLETRIGDVVVDSDSIFGSTTASRMGSGKDSGINYISTTALRWTYVSNQLKAIALAPNGGSTVTQTLGGVTTGGQAISVSRSRQVTLRNVDVVRLYAWPERRTTIAGREWQSGATNFLVEDISYSGTPIDSIQIGKIGYAALYGASAQNGVVRVFTQKASDIGKQVTLTVTGESDSIGVRYVAGLVTRGGVTTTLGTVNGATLDGSQLATRRRAADDYTLPQGVYYQSTARMSQGVIPMEYDCVDERATFYDNQAAIAGVGAVQPPSRELTVGNRAFDSSNRLGLSGNMLGNTTDLKRFVNFAAFTDHGAGLDPNAALTFYRSPNRATVFDSANIITSASGFPATNTPTDFLGVSFKELAGNTGFYVARTNAANPVGVNGDALFGRLTSGGSMVASGFTSGMAWGKTNWGTVTPQLQLKATGSYWPTNGYFGYAIADGATDYCILGAGNACNESVVLGGTTSLNGTQLDYNLSLGFLKQRRAQLEGGSGNGIVAGAYWAGDFGGNWAAGGYSMMSPFWGLIDDSPPTASLSATFPTPGMVSVTATLMDDFGDAVGRPGIRFNLQNPIFSGGKLYAIFDEFPFGGDWLTGLSKTFSMTYDAPIVKSGRFFNPNTGQITNTTFLSDGAYFEGFDYGRNAGRAFLNYSNTGPAEPAPTGLLQMFYNLGGTQVCNGSACAGNVPTTVDMWLEAFTSTSSPPVAKASFMLIPSDGVVEYIGKAVTPVTTQVGSTWRHRYLLTWKPSDVCVRSGRYDGKVMALSASGTQALFPDAFRSLDVRAPSSGGNRCAFPMRDLKYTF